MRRGVLQSAISYISYRLGLPGIMFMCLSVSFLIIPSAPIITGMVVVLKQNKFYFQVFLFTYFTIFFD